MMKPIPLSDEEYVAIGKVVEREVRTLVIEGGGGSVEQMRAAKEALQALAFGNEMRIEGVSLKICCVDRSEEDDIEDAVLKDTDLVKDEIVEMTSQVFFDLNIIIQQEHPSLMI